MLQLRHGQQPEGLLPRDVLTVYSRVSPSYYIFDTANSQKDYFRERDGERLPKKFPALPWGELKDPKYLETRRGTRLLLSGWYVRSGVVF